MIAQLRATEGTPFHISVAVSPFLYTRDELPRTVPAARTEGRGRRESRHHAGRMGRAEVRRAETLRRRSRPAASRCSATCTCSRVGPPSRWPRRTRPAAGFRRNCSTSLRKESDAADGGLQARLERAARTLAVLKGLGYAGAYITGTHAADHVDRDPPPRRRARRRLAALRRRSAVRRAGRLLSRRLGVERAARPARRRRPSQPVTVSVLTKRENARMSPTASDRHESAPHHRRRHCGRHSARRAGDLRQRHAARSICRSCGVSPASRTASWSSSPPSRRPRPVKARRRRASR